MIKTTRSLLFELKDYKNPRDKISRMVKTGQLIPIKQGLYETDKNVNPIYLASSIYGPSYISFEYVLLENSLIPDYVYSVTCATFKKHKSKLYQTPLGNYHYRDIPLEAFPYGVRFVKEGNYSYMIATKEKALCDYVYTLPRLDNLKDMEFMLIEDMRIDEEELSKLNIEYIEFLQDKYHSKNVSLLAKYLRRAYGSR